MSEVQTVFVTTVICVALALTTVMVIGYFHE